MYRAYVSGAIWILCWVAALFFFKFWRKSGERLFLFFAAAFGLLGIERIVGLYGRGEGDLEGYVIRLCAFVLILVAIVQKNRAKR